MDKDTRYRRNETLPFQEIEGQVVIVCPARQELHRLDEVATWLWNLMDQPRSVPELAKALREEFEVEREPAERDVRAFLDDLQNKGLITRP
jgi:hypothetical protein